jgi:hypothetical protein
MEAERESKSCFVARPVGRVSCRGHLSLGGGVSLPAGLVEWLAGGERGISSNTMVTHLFGINALGDWPWPSHPHDPADLRRCRLLIQQVPEVGRELPRMATCSAEWAALVAHWDELCALLDKELRDPRRSAPLTYRRMRELIESATAATMTPAGVTDSRSINETSSSVAVGDQHDSTKEKP